MRLFGTLLLLATGLYFMSCNDPVGDPCTSGGNNRKDTTVDLTAYADGFNSPDYIIIHPQFQSSVQLGSSPSLDLNGPDNLLSRFGYQQLGDTLYVNYIQCVRGSAPIDASFTLPSPKGFVLRDSASLVLDNLSISDFSLEAHGKSFANVSVPFKTLKLTHDGIGTILLSDSISEAHIKMEDRGIIDASEAWIEDAYITHNGKGDIKVYAHSSLHVVIADSGNVYYKGPAVVSKTITGHGQLIQL